MPIPPYQVSPLQRAILLAVLYADMFDYPLTEAEIFQSLIRLHAGRQEFRTALSGLQGEFLSRRGPYHTWKGRENLAHMRAERRQAGRTLWDWARRYSRWLAWVPFVRMAAVSGSLAVGNASGKADIDFFIITEKRRLWIARLCLVLLRVVTGRLPRVFPVSICPNYSLSLDSLEVENRNLYTAHEVVQAAPLWGRESYIQFRRANRWVTNLLPNTPPILTGRDLPRRPVIRPVRWAERALSGRAGDLVNALLYQLFWLYHRLVRSFWLARRLEKDPAARPAFRWGYMQMIRKAFQLERQTSINDGYAKIVRQRFHALLHQRAPFLATEEELDRLFPSGPLDPSPLAGQAYSLQFHQRLFLESYGPK